MTFMQANVGHFDEFDENKLEYTGIYESYVTIMEDIIDAKLVERFSTEDIEAFYHEFRDNYMTYEAQDKETVDKLFELTDFVRFKDSMLIKKAAISQDSSAGGQSAKSSNDNLFSAVSDDKEEMEGFFWAMNSEDPDDSSTGWRKRLTFDNASKGVLDAVIHSKKVDGFKVEITRCSCVFPGISMETFDKYIMDMEELYKRRNGKGLTFDVLERSVDGFPHILYYNLPMPLFMTDRDCCFRMTKTVNDKGQVIYIS